MSFYSNIISTSSNPATQMAMVLDGSLTSAGYVKVSANVNDNVANIAPAGIWNVYKSPGTNNSIGQDWYLAIGWEKVSNANLMFSLFESWNATTNLYSNAVPFSNGQSILPNTSTYQSPFGANTFSSGNAYIFYCPTMPKTDGVQYYYSVTIDRLLFAEGNASSQNNGGGVYIGTYDSFLSPTIDVMPLVISNVATATSGAGTSNVGGFTREPLQSTGSTYNFTGGGGFVWNYLENNISTPNIYNGKSPFSRITLLGRDAVSARGLYKDLIAAKGTSSVGDIAQFTVGGNTYSCVVMTKYPSITGTGTAVALPAMLEI